MDVTTFPARQDSDDPPDGADSYPRESARTQRYTLGEPRNVVVSPDGRRIVFLRSRHGTDTVNCLWVVDAATGEERLVADPADLLGGRDDEELPPEERARRERAREQAGGITTFATDAAVTVTAFTIAGRLFVGGLSSGQARELPWPGRCSTPAPTRRPSASPTSAGGCCASASSTAAGACSPAVRTTSRRRSRWGSAEFVAAEEMGRMRGYWWSPDGTALAVARVDTAPIQRWFLGDPADPASAPAELPYPAAGTPNADVTLHVIGLDGVVVDVEWDRAASPYLADVQWSEAGLIATVQTRDQRAVDGAARRPGDRRHERRSSRTATSVWVDLVAGVPRLLPDGTLVTCADRDGARRLARRRRAGHADRPAGARGGVGDRRRGRLHGQRHRRLDLGAGLALDGRRRSWRALTDEPGVHAVGGRRRHGRRADDDAGRARRPLGDARRHRARQPRGDAGDPRRRSPISFAGDSRIATAVLLPRDHDGSPLPVLLDPYGGPHGPRVVQTHNAHLASQWFADQGFAVVVADGRGTPGRGSAWERSVHHDLAHAGARRPDRRAPPRRRRCTRSST